MKAIEKLVPGQVVYDVGRTKMGNTTLTTMTIWPVKIVSVDVEKRRVTASWNNNPARMYAERHWSKWRLTRPMTVSTGGMGQRLATREEIAKAKAAAAG